MSSTYFWSGSNHPGEIRGLNANGKNLGVAVDVLLRKGRNGGVPTGELALQELESLCPRKRIWVNVSQARGGKPILFFNRKKAQLPEGDVPVQVGGKRWVVGFRKIAANVAREVSGGINRLGELLRGLVGPDAGKAGAGHKAILELTATGWKLRAGDLAELKASGAKVFVDSGAFGEVRFDPTQGRMVDVRPISDAQWRERLAAYRRIAKALGGQCYLVAPDKVGDQNETLRRLQRYALQVQELRQLGANIIVPLQRGELSGAAFDEACTRVLGFGDYIRGIPSKKAAATVAEIGELSDSLPAETKVHLLGLGPWGHRYDEVIRAINRPSEQVFCDSVRIKALVGRSNGKDGGPRVLTAIRDAILAEAGAALSTIELKAKMLDRYFQGVAS